MMQVKKKKTKALAGGKKQKRGPGKVKDGQRQADEVQFVEAPYSYYDGYRHCPHSHRVTFIKGLLDKPVCFVDSYDFEDKRYTHENPRQQPPILPDIHLNNRQNSTLANLNIAANKLEATAAAAAAAAAAPTPSNAVQPVDSNSSVPLLVSDKMADRPQLQARESSNLHQFVKSVNGSSRGGLSRVSTSLDLGQNSKATPQQPISRLLFTDAPPDISQSERLPAVTSPRGGLVNSRQSSSLDLLRRSTDSQLGSRLRHIANNYTTENMVLEMMCQLLNKNAREVETWLGSAPETDKERVRYLVWRAMMERGKENSRVSSRYSTPLSLPKPLSSRLPSSLKADATTLLTPHVTTLTLPLVDE